MTKEVNWEDLPGAIQEQMLDNQEAQGNPRDEEVFEDFITADAMLYGFDWNKSPEGFGYWRDVIARGQVDTEIPGKN